MSNIININAHPKHKPRDIIQEKHEAWLNREKRGGYDKLSKPKQPLPDIIEQSWPDTIEAGFLFSPEKISSAVFQLLDAKDSERTQASSQAPDPDPTKT